MNSAAAQAKFIRLKTVQLVENAGLPVYRCIKAKNTAAFTRYEPRQLDVPGHMQTTDGLLIYHEDNKRLMRNPAPTAMATEVRGFSCTYLLVA